MMTLLAHTVLQRFPGGAEMRNGNFCGPAWELSRLSLGSTPRINTRGRGQAGGARLAAHLQNWTMATPSVPCFLEEKFPTRIPGRYTFYYCDSLIGL